jgi:hypothetical protein
MECSVVQVSVGYHWHARQSQAFKKHHPLVRASEMYIALIDGIIIHTHKRGNTT